MNPFDDNMDDNPFDTPEAAPATTSYQPPASNPSNPFDAPAHDPKPQANPYAQQPSTSAAYSPNAPTQPQKSFFGQIAGDDTFIDPVSGMPITKKQLDQKEAQLQQKEADLAKVEQQVQDGTYVSSNDRNFPPYLKWWAYHPDRDMPSEAVKMVKIIFYIYLATCAVYLINFIGCLSCLTPSVATRTSSVATKIVLSVLFLLFLCPISFEVSFFVLYKALKKGKALKFFCFLATYIIWFVILAINAIGLDDGGSVGFIQMIGIFNGNAAVGIIALIFCILACCDGAAMVWTFLWLLKYYKKVGLDKKALQEGTAVAASYAVEHKEEIGQYAADNRDALGANPYANNNDF